MQRNNLCAFGIEVKKKLIDLNQPQTWLIAEVKSKTGLYFDGRYLSKILTGKMSTPKIVESIASILELDHHSTKQFSNGDNLVSDEVPRQTM